MARYRRGLQIHCCRMLGSFQDAEDALQDTLRLPARGLGGFEGRASLRTWLYRIATSRCLNMRRSASRRPAKAWDVPGVEPPEPTRLGEVAWLEPYPDALFDGAIDVTPGPEARYEQTESISLAFVTALQILPPRHSPSSSCATCSDSTPTVADMLDDRQSANSALDRARAGLQRRGAAADHKRPPASNSTSGMRSWRSSSARTSPPISTHWWPF
jgi:RNA polymerase sigma-70 factor (ECF subfamily)